MDKNKRRGDWSWMNIIYGSTIALFAVSIILMANDNYLSWVVTALYGIFLGILWIILQFINSERRRK